jgi:hypothetical protein
MTFRKLRICEDQIKKYTILYIVLYSIYGVDLLLAHAHVRICGTVLYTVTYSNCAECFRRDSATIRRNTVPYACMQCIYTLCMHAQCIHVHIV